MVGDAGYYSRVCQQQPEHLRDREPWRILFARRDGNDVGFAMFRRSHKWEKARPAGDLEVWAVIGEAAAQLALIRRLVDFDLMGTVKVRTVGVDAPRLTSCGRLPSVITHSEPSSRRSTRGIRPRYWGST